MIIEKNIGKAIKSARKDAGLTQEKLAEIIDVSSTYIRYLETGRRLPSVITLYNIAVELNMSIDDIFFHKELKNKSLLTKVEQKLIKCSSNELTIIYLIVDSMLKVPKNKT